MESRLASLDGLRGVAALVVVVHHLTLLSAARFAIFSADAVPPPPGSVLWWLEGTPLVLTVVGGEAVFVFFVLSGFVVTRPALAPGFDWLAYYPRRVLRLVLPVVGSVALAVVVILLTPQDPSTATSEWARGSLIEDLDPRLALSATEVLFGDISINNPLWTLRWELLFSLLLPVYVVIVLALRRWWPLGMLGCLAVLVVSWIVPNPAWRFLPMFLLGAFLAVALPALQARLAARPITGGAHLLWALGLALALLALAARWLLWPVTAGTPFVTSIPGVISIAGATMVVVIATLWPPVVRLLSTAVFGWLGRISFSLYLVHVPLLLGVVAFFPGSPWYVPAAVAFPVVLIGAELFARFVEIPAHRFSRYVGRRASTLVARSTP